MDIQICRARRVFACAALVVLFGLFLSCGGSNVFVIAAFLPEEENGEDRAAPVRQGMELASEELNVRGGIYGKIIDIRFYSLSADPAKKDAATAACLQSIKSDKPLLMISLGKTLSEYLSAIAEEQAIPLIALSVPDDNFTAEKRWVFRNALTYAEECRALLRLFEYLRVKRVGILHSARDGDEQYIAALTKMLAEAATDIELTTHMYAGADGETLGGGGGETGIGQDISLNALLHMPALLFPERGDALTSLLEFCAAAPYLGKLIGRSDILSRVSAPAREVYSVAPGMYRQQRGMYSRILDIFQAQFGTEMPLEAVIAYDTLIMLSKALSPGAIRDALEAEFVYPSLFGIRFSPAGAHDFVPQLYPVRRTPEGAIEYLEDELEYIENDF
jgi:ABC-type branched-subunit amino acid transport system substrate-binding protein